MKTAKLIIDGKEIEVQISDKQVEELTAPEKVTGFERGDKYWYIDPEFDVVSRYDEHDETTDFIYKVVNYYTDKELAKWCNRSDILTRQMRRWAAEHNAESVNLDDGYYNGGWCIAWDVETNKVEPYNCCTTIEHGKVYFNTKEIAEAAIKEFGDEIRWLAEDRPKWF